MRITSHILCVYEDGYFKKAGSDAHDHIRIYIAVFFLASTKVLPVANQLLKFKTTYLLRYSELEGFLQDLGVSARVLFFG